jgi:predicted N-acetyltransferase YhbS
VSDVTIRSESSADIDAVSTVNGLAFAPGHPYSRQTEHLIVDALRDAGALSVSLVAVLDGAVVGHIALSPGLVGDAVAGWYVLGPVAVVPEHQSEGIGSSLVEAGLEQLKARDARGCVLVGDPGFYSRFGFRTHPGLVYEGVPGEYVLGLSLGADAPSGEIRAHEAFLVEAGRDGD